MRMNTLGIITAFILVLLPQISAAQVIATASSEGTPYQVREVLTGLGIPWGLSFVSTDELLITERSGTLKRFNRKNQNLTNISGIPEVLDEGQGGLLDIAPSPNFHQDRWIYFTYSKASSHGGRTVLARAKYQEASLGQWQDLLVTQTQSNSSRHYGSRIAFDDAGHVFFSVGDRGNREHAQDISNHAGTIIRLNLDGSIPVDNPFAKEAKALKEIWSYGHRNPQGLSFSADKKVLWSIEHGPRGGDEINRIKPGLNYGWPTISYGKEYWGPIAVGEGTHKDGMEQPIKYYVPSIAPSSLIVYAGKAFPAWKNNLFSGALRLTHLNRVVVDDAYQTIHEERILEDLGERIRAIAVSQEGWLYLSTDSGKILEISPL